MQFTFLLLDQEAYGQFFALVILLLLLLSPSRGALDGAYDTLAEIGRAHVVRQGATVVRFKLVGT